MIKKYLIQMEVKNNKSVSSLFDELKLLDKNKFEYIAFCHLKPSIHFHLLVISDVPRDVIYNNPKYVCNTEGDVLIPKYNRFSLEAYMHYIYEHRYKNGNKIMNKPMYDMISNDTDLDNHLFSNINDIDITDIDEVVDYLEGKYELIDDDDKVYINKINDLTKAISNQDVVYLFRHIDDFKNYKLITDYLKINSGKSIEEKLRDLDKEI